MQFQRNEESIWVTASKNRPFKQVEKSILHLARLSGACVLYPEHPMKRKPT